MTDFLIGIDAGGTKTRALAYRTDDFSPVPESEARTGPGNVTSDPKGACGEILRAAEACSEKARFLLGGTCRYVSLGAAGFSSVAGQAMREDGFDQRLSSLSGGFSTKVSDATLSLHANFASGEPGMTVIVPGIALFISGTSEKSSACIPASLIFSKPGIFAAKWPSFSCCSKEHVEYTSIPPRFNSLQAFIRSSFCSLTELATSFCEKACFSSIRFSWRVPLPEQGASSRIRSNLKKSSSFRASVFKTLTRSHPKRRRLLRRRSHRMRSGSHAVTIHCPFES